MLVTRTNIMATSVGLELWFIPPGVQMAVHKVKTISKINKRWSDEELYQRALIMDALERYSQAFSTMPDNLERLNKFVKTAFLRGQLRIIHYIPRPERTLLTLLRRS